MDTDKDGLLHFDEFQESLANHNITISTEHLQIIFNDIHASQQGLLEMLDDSIETLLDDFDKTISLAEVEDYLHRLLPKTPDERFFAIAKSCLKSASWWAIVGNLVSKFIRVFGLAWLGPFQLYVPSSPGNRWILALHQSLNVIGCIGFNSLFYKTASQRFHAFETAERTIVQVFGGDAADDEVSEIVRRLSTVVPTSSTRAADLDAVMNIEDLKLLLEEHGALISDAALHRLFRKIDTSRDRLTSSREIMTFIHQWQPATKEQRAIVVAGALFTMTERAS
jgi:hypothetical protein